MKATPEQKAIIHHIRKHDGLLMTSAVAGSGKTTLLVAIAEDLRQHTNASRGLYMAYNKAIAVEAKQRFPSYVQSCTTHSLAYKPTVIDNKLKLGHFSWRQITEKLKFDTKYALVEDIREFCLSEHLSFDAYAKANSINPKSIPLANKYLDLMQSGKVDCTHEFYLKMFHILLAHGHLTYEPFDFIALDEAGDLNPVTLAIFNLLPSPKKIMVGDKHQNIYQFNHTINCFEVMADKGVTLPMSQSFRVSTDIAKRIESFCQSYMDPKMSFKGIDIFDKTIKTSAYISRTNSMLIGKMMELNKLGIQYGLTRTPKQIFEVPLMLCGLRYKGFIGIPQYKHIQDQFNEYTESSNLHDEYRSPLAYIRACNEDDLGLQNAINVIGKYTKKAIIECYEEASKHQKLNQSYILGTAHSTKGLTSH